MIEDRIKYLRAQIRRYDQQIALTADARLQSIYKLFMGLSVRELALHERNAILTEPVRNWAQSRRIEEEPKKSLDVPPPRGKTLL